MPTRPPPTCRTWQVRLADEGNKSREAQAEILGQLGQISHYREKLLELREHEKEETGASFAEVCDGKRAVGCRRVSAHP